MDQQRVYARTLIRLCVFLFAAGVTFLVFAHGYGYWSPWSDTDPLDIANKNKEVGNIVVATIPLAAVSLASGIAYIVALMPQDSRLRNLRRDRVFRGAIVGSALALVVALIHSTLMWPEVRGRTLSAQELEWLKRDVLFVLLSAMLYEIMISWRTEWYESQPGKP